VSWLVVPEVAWTTPETGRVAPRPLSAWLPFPTGSAENRLGRQLQDSRRVRAMWLDRTIFSQVMCWTDWATFSGHHVARPAGDGVDLVVIP
jgi:hypothetical protein